MNSTSLSKFWFQICQPALHPYTADGTVYAWDVRQTVDDQPQHFKKIGDELVIDESDQDLTGQTKQGSAERKKAGTALKAAKKGSTSHSSNVLGRGRVETG